jgi:hypothetical protein
MVPGSGARLVEVFVDFGDGSLAETIAGVYRLTKQSNSPDK